MGPTFRAWLLGVVVGVVIIGVWSGGSPDRMVFGDGVVYRVVAGDLTASHAGAGLGGGSLRYGRIGLPFALWLSSFGRPDLLPYAQPLVMVLCAGFVAAAADQLLSSRKLYFALIPFAAAGLISGIAGGYTEPLALALGLWSVVFASRGRWVWASLLGAAAGLTRESAMVVALGIAVWAFTTGRAREGATMLLGFVPVLAWHLFILSWLGTLPLLDPWLRSTDAFGLPIVAMIDAIANAPSLTAAAFVAVHAVAIGVALVVWRSGPLGAVAATSAIALLFAGPQVWRYMGDASRVAVFLDVCLLLVLIQLALARDAASPRTE